MYKASNSLSPQELLQYVAAILNYIDCAVFLRNADRNIPWTFQTQ